MIDGGKGEVEKGETEGREEAEAGAAEGKKKRSFLQDGNGSELRTPGT